VLLVGQPKAKAFFQKAESEFGTQVDMAATYVVPDEIDLIQKAVLAWCDGSSHSDSAFPSLAQPPHMIITSGGTGFAVSVFFSHLCSCSVLLSFIDF
jgi:molybdopterin biosynthesis enzyme MoaB